LISDKVAIKLAEGAMRRRRAEVDFSVRDDAETSQD
jgi:hypothetical protein